MTEKTKRKHLRLNESEVTVISGKEVRASKTVPSMPYYNKNLPNRRSQSLEDDFKTEEDEIGNYTDIINDDGGGPWVFLDEMDVEQNRDTIETLRAIFPDIIDDYILVRHLKARGYEVRIDGSEVLVEGELIENYDPSGADFYFTTSRVSNDPQVDVASLDALMHDLPLGRYERSAKVPVIAIISDSGKVYGLRLHHVDLKKGGKNPFNLYRIERGRRSRNYQDEIVAVNRALSIKEKPAKFSDAGIDAERGSYQLPR